MCGDRDHHQMMIISTCAPRRGLFSVNVGSGSAASGLLKVCTWNMYMCTCGCTITKPGRGSRSLPTLCVCEFSTSVLQAYASGASKQASSSSRTRKAQRSTSNKGDKCRARCATLLPLAAADGIRTRSPRSLAGETRMKIRSRTSSIFLERVAMMKWVLCKNVGLAGY